MDQHSSFWQRLHSPKTARQYTSTGLWIHACGLKLTGKAFCTSYRHLRIRWCKGKGRTGRVCDGVVCRISQQPPRDVRSSRPCTGGVRVVLAAASLGVPWPPPALQWTMPPHVESDLERMGLIIPKDNEISCTTPLGEECLRGHMDVRQNLLVAVATALRIKCIGLIAAAFLDGRMEHFTGVYQSGGDFGLDSRQLQLGVTTGTQLGKAIPLGIRAHILRSEIKTTRGQ